MNKLILVSMASFLLLACGGESGGGSTPSPAPSTDKQTTVQKTEDLVAPDGFEFNPITTHTLNVNLSGSLLERAHLSLYSRYKETEKGAFVVEYDSKIIDAAMTNGNIDIEFVLAETQKEIVAEIWSYDGSAPLQKKFIINNNALIW